MSQENCKHGSLAPLTALATLPENQSGAGRHKCAVCAYNKGVEDTLDAFSKSTERYIRDVMKAELMKSHQPPELKRVK